MKVGPYSYEVLFNDDAMAAAGANGALLPDTMTVLLGSQNDEQVIKETLVHELFGHAAWKLGALDLRWPDADKDSPGEQIIATLSPIWFGIIRENPELIRYLTEES